MCMSRSKPEYARIPVKPATRDVLRAVKIGGETYDDVVRRIMEDSDVSVSRLSDDPGESSSQRGE